MKETCMQLGGRSGASPSHAAPSYYGGSFEGQEEEEEETGDGARAGLRMFGRIWPDLNGRPLAQHRSKTEQTCRQRESAPEGTHLNSEQNEDWKNARKSKQEVIGLFFSQRAKLFLPSTSQAFFVLPVFNHNTAQHEHQHVHCLY